MSDYPAAPSPWAARTGGSSRDVPSRDLHRLSTILQEKCGRKVALIVPGAVVRPLCPW